MAVIREGGPNPRRPINPTPPSTRPQPKKIPRFADGTSSTLPTDRIQQSGDAFMLSDGTGSTLPTDRIQQSGDAFMLGSPRPGMTTAAPTGTPDPTFKPPVQYSPPMTPVAPTAPTGTTYPSGSLPAPIWPTTPTNGYWNATGGFWQPPSSTTPKPPPTGFPTGTAAPPRGPQPNDMARQNANPNAAFNRQGAMPPQAQAPQRRPINPAPPSARPMGRRQPMTASQMMQLRRPTMPTRPGTPPPQMRQGQMPTQISQLLQGLRRPDQV